MIKVGLFGGSFNPIHIGHIALAKAALKECELDEVWLMVSPQNPLKQQEDLLPDRLRYEMAQRALEGIEGVKASDYEFRLPKPSYTWNTLQHLVEDYLDCEFVLLIGGGTIDVPLRNVASTEIRRRVKAGGDIEGMVPECIIPLVKKYYHKE